MVDVKAFNRLTEPYHRRLYGVALALCKDADQAADLTQDALVRAFERFHTFRRGAPVYPWLARILRNLYLDSFKTGRARHEIPEHALSEGQAAAVGEGATGSEADALAAAERSQLLGWLAEEIRALPVEQSTLVTLCDVQGMTYEEAAEVCEVPVGTVRSRLSRARARLRQALQGRARKSTGTVSEVGS